MSAIHLTDEPDSWWRSNFTLVRLCLAWVFLIAALLKGGLLWVSMPTNSRPVAFSLILFELFLSGCFFRAFSADYHGGWLRAASSYSRSCLSYD